MPAGNTSLHSNKTGLCLSGGGLRGIAHLGVIQALEEHGLTPAMISGTSAGAIVGAFYAAGYTPQEMLEIAGETNFFALINFRGGGWFSTDIFMQLFERYLPDNRFEALLKPLHVAATDFSNGTTHYFNSGQLHTALMASASLPLIFPPMNIDGAHYMDGGILNNLPIEPIENSCDLLIGSHVNSAGKLHKRMPGRAQILSRSFHLLMSSVVYMKAHRCHLFFDPPELIRVSMFDRSSARKLYDYGYEYASRKLDT